MPRDGPGAALRQPRETHGAPYLSFAASGSTARSVPGSCASGAFRTCSASDTVTLDDPGGSGRAPNWAAPGCFPNRSFARTGAAGLFCSVAGRITGTLWRDRNPCDCSSVSVTVSPLGTMSGDFSRSVLLPIDRFASACQSDVFGLAGGADSSLSARAAASGVSSSLRPAGAGMVDLFVVGGGYPPRGAGLEKQGAVVMLSLGGRVHEPEERSCRRQRREPLRARRHRPRSTERQRLQQERRPAHLVLPARPPVACETRPQKVPEVVCSELADREVVLQFVRPVRRRGRTAVETRPAHADLAEQRGQPAILGGHQRLEAMTAANVSRRIRLRVSPLVLPVVRLDRLAAVLAIPLVVCLALAALGARLVPLPVMSRSADLGARLAPHPRPGAAVRRRQLRTA